METPHPTHQNALDLYRWRAGCYDWQLAPYEHIRAAAVERLRLRPGQTVLDVGCGTGLSLDRLQQAVGPGGRVVGLDLCPEMVAQARQRVAQHRWPQVQLVCQSTDHAPLPQGADAALFHFTHDIVHDPEALDHVLDHLKPGARVVATGLKWTSPFLLPLNALVWFNAVQSITHLGGLGEPWAPLLARGIDLELEQWVMGTIFVVSGTWPGPDKPH